MGSRFKMEQTSNDLDHITEDIIRYVNGHLSPAEVDQLWAELIQDNKLMDYLKTVANIKEVIKNKNR